MKWAIVRTVAKDAVRAPMEQELADRTAVELFNPLQERLRLGDVTYRPAQAGEPVDLWMSVPGEGLVRRAYVKETP